MPRRHPLKPSTIARAPAHDGGWRRAGLAIVIALFALGAVIPIVEAAPRRADIRRAAEAVLLNGDLQQTQPPPGAPEP